MSKFCVTCKHYKYKDIEDMNQCLRNQTITKSLVTGRPEKVGEPLLCERERHWGANDYRDMCGTIGRYYVVKENSNEQVENKNY